MSRLHFQESEYQHGLSKVDMPLLVCAALQSYSVYLHRSQFLQCAVLKNTLLQHRVKFSVRNKTVQILHSYFHYLLFWGESSLYNNLQWYIENSTMAMIRSMLKEDITVTVAQIQK